jgi:hypothetical protein
MTRIKLLLLLFIVILSLKADSRQILFDRNGHFYQRFDTTLTWSDAVKYCQARGGHLVTITTPEENEFVYRNFGIEGANLWIGATDEVTERTWRWVTGEPFVYNNWATQMPDNASQGQNYAIFWDLDPGRWDDNGLPVCDCKYMFVCEWENLL